MYKFIKNKYIRNFIIIFSLISCISFGYKQEKVQAIAIVDDAIMVGGVALAPEIGIALVGAGLLYGGYKLAEPYVEDFKNYCFNEMRSHSIDKLFSIKSDSNGKQYATITPQGIDTVQSMTKQATKTGIPVKTDATYTSPPTSATGAKPYMYKGFYMRPYRGASGNDYVYDTISVASGDTVNIYITHTDTSSYYNYSLKATAELLLQFYSYETSEGSYMGIRYSYDGGATYTRLGSGRGVVKIKEQYLYWGYKTTSNQAYALNAISGEGIDGNASDKVSADSSVAVPISGQYENSSGSEVYGIDGAVGEFSGLSSDTTTVPGEGSSTESTESTGVISGVINAVGDKVTSAVSAVEGAIGSVGSAIKSVLSSIANTVTKIYDWACDLVGDIVNAFSGWLDNIIELLSSIWNWCVTLVETIVVSLVDAFTGMLTSVFVPAADFFMNNFNEIKGMIFDKIGYDQYVDIFGDGSSKELKDITINWYGKTIVICKLTTFNYFRNLFNDLVYGFTFFGLAIYNYNQIYRIFRNNNYAKMEQTIERMKK